MENACRVPVYSQTETAEARRVAVRLASDLAFDETDAGNVAIVVTEAATNLLKHAGGGELILRTADDMVEMLALDSGPGIADVSRSFQDGYSTAGTLGGGLGAISRLSSYYDVYTQPGRGTALLARVGKRAHARPPRQSANARFSVGAVSVPKSGETVCGDSWGFQPMTLTSGRLIIADGLGHGLRAGEASRAAVEVALRETHNTTVALMQRIHEVLRPTRGAAVAVADVDTASGLVRYTGIGNISGSVLPVSGAVRHMVSHPGSAGHEVRKITEFTYMWEPGCILIMHSDGLQSHWSLDRYAGLLRRDPSLIAAVLYRDFTRKNDDLTVAVLCEGGERP